MKQKKQNKEVKVYYADSGNRVYEANRRNYGKKFKLPDCMCFIDEVQKTMKTNKHSIDAVIGDIVAQNKYKASETVCTKIFYNYVDLGLLETKNIDLLLKVTRNNKSKKKKENIRVLGRRIDERHEYIGLREEF